MGISLGLLTGLLPVKLQPKAKAVITAIFGVLTCVALFVHQPWVAAALQLLNTLGVHQIPNMPEQNASDTQGV